MGKTIKNLADFAPPGTFGELLNRAKYHNRLRQKIKNALPEVFRPLDLSSIENDTAIFITDNSALAYRAERQKSLMVRKIQTIETLEHICKIKICIGRQK